MFPYDMLAVRQRHAEMLREAELNRLAHQLGGEDFVESLISRMTKFLSFAWLPQREQRDEVVTHPRPA